MSSPFGGIPRNWKQTTTRNIRRSLKDNGVPPSGGSLEIGNFSSAGWQCSPNLDCSPFGGIPRNWKQPSGFQAQFA